MLTRKFIAISLFLFLSVLSVAQVSEADSLNAALKTAKGDNRIDVLNKLIKFIYKKDLSTAKKYVQEIEKNTGSSLPRKIDLLLNKGRIVAFEEKDQAKAITYYKDALKLALSVNYEEGIKFGYDLTSNAYGNLNDYETAIKIIDEGILKANEFKDETIKAYLLRDKGTFFYYQAKTEEALKIFEEALSIYKKKDKKLQVAGLTMNIGIMKYRMGKTKESIEYYKRSEIVYEQLRDSLNIANVLINIAISETDLGEVKKAINEFKKAADIYKALKHDMELAGAYDNIGGSYKAMGELNRSFQFYLSAYKIREKENDPSQMASSYLKLGSIKEMMGDTNSTIDYFSKAIAIYKSIGEKRQYTLAVRNLSGVLLYKKRFAEAKVLLEEARAISEETNDIVGQAYSYLSLGNFYKMMKDNDQALEYYENALKLQKEIGDKEATAGLLNNIGVIYSEKKMYKRSIEYYSTALKMRQEIGSKSEIADSYISISNSYADMNDYLKAYENYRLYHKTWDSVYNNTISEQVTEMNTRFETEKKDKEIILRTAAEKEALIKAEKETLEKNAAQSRSLYLGLAVILMLALVGFVVYTNIQRKKDNILLVNQKQEIQVQKNIIEENSKDITDSIKYARRIQEAILPADRLVKEHLKDSFILYKPKAIVSGDFYWMQQNNNTTLFAACDCTGHGVPGAMVSVVSHNALDRAVKEFGLTKPSDILNKVNELVEETFSASENEVRDGMDIALVSLTPNGDHYDLEYAGANNPLWIVTKNEFKEIKADKQPIGRYENRKPFTNNKLLLAKSDTVYVFSDGFADQFGGPKGKKFKLKNFSELLLSIRDRSMTEQKELIANAFDEWKGKLDQVDDICVIGVRV